jgi:TRAP-type uncharacterized transport system substrate-binding protein
MRRRRSLPTWLYGLVATGLTVATLIAVFAILKPTPPRTVVISTGPDGSAYQRYAERYREHFAENGIELVLRPSAGVSENLARLSDPESDVGAGFGSLDMTTTENAPDLRSLGALFFEPVWVFYSNPAMAVTAPSELEGMRIAIGRPGGLANFAAMRLLSLLEVSETENEIVSLEPAESADRLRRGEIDVAIFAAPAETPLIRDLLASDAVDLANFTQADAYIALYPSLTKLVVPAGVGSLAGRRPAQDVTILAFTATLLVKESLHPAIQSLFLDAATRVHAAPDMFHTVARFPRPETLGVPLSTSADQFYKNGRPFLQRYLPFWLVVLAKQLFAILLTLVGVVYPVLRLLPSAFGWAMHRRITRLYGELRLIELEAGTTDDAERRARLADDLEDLDRRVRGMRLPESFAPQVYTLRTHINVVRSRFASS